MSYALNFSFLEPTLRQPHRSDHKRDTNSRTALFPARA
jgi:hypothetical protein